MPTKKGNVRFFQIETINTQKEIDLDRAMGFIQELDSNEIVKKYRV